MKSLLSIAFFFITLTTQAADPVAYTPNEAIADALSSPLHFVGKGKLYGYDTISSCLYRNDKVLVLHGYCISPEAPAADIQIYSPARGQVVAMHAESYNDATPISLANPKSYPPEYWYIFLGTLQEGELSLTSSFSDFANFYEARYSKYPPNCITGLNGTKCDAPLKEFAQRWLPAAVSFRKNPSTAWKNMLNTVKALTQ